MRGQVFASDDYMSHRVSTLSGAAVGPEQLSTLLDSVREVIAILSADDLIQFASQGFASVLGHCTEDLAGKPLASLVHANDSTGVWQCLREITASGDRAASFRCRLRSNDGSWRWFDCTARNHTNTPGIEGIVVSCQDVTDLQRMEAERQVISEVVHALNETANLDELLVGIHKALRRFCMRRIASSRSTTPKRIRFRFRFLRIKWIWFLRLRK
jgi:PAS domain S-box-containing protein